MKRECNLREGRKTGEGEVREKQGSTFFFEKGVRRTSHALFGSAGMGEKRGKT